MRWSRRRRHARGRKQMRLVIEQFIQANRNHDYTATARLEKLVSLQQWCHAFTAGKVPERMMSPSLRRRVVAALFHQSPYSTSRP